MWAIIRANVLGTEIFSVEVGHQAKAPEVASDEPADSKEITGGTSMAGFDRRPVEDARDTDGWLPTAEIGFQTNV